MASIAINEDVTESIKYEQYLHKQNRTEESGDAMEFYRGDVNKMLDYLINSALLEVGKNPSAMTKEDKMRCGAAGPARSVPHHEVRIKGL